MVPDSDTWTTWNLRFGSCRYERQEAMSPCSSLSYTFQTVPTFTSPASVSLQPHPAAVQGATRHAAAACSGSLVRAVF